MYNPPKGYEYYGLNGIFIKKQNNSQIKSKNPLNQTKFSQFFTEIRKNFYLRVKGIIIFNQIIKELIRRNLSKIIRQKTPDILYSINRRLLNIKTPWIVDAEHVGAFTYSYCYPGLRKKK